MQTTAIVTKPSFFSLPFEIQKEIIDLSQVNPAILAFVSKAFQNISRRWFDGANQNMLSYSPELRKAYDIQKGMISARTLFEIYQRIIDKAWPCFLPSASHTSRASLAKLIYVSQNPMPVNLNNARVYFRSNIKELEFVQQAILQKINSEKKDESEKAYKEFQFMLYTPEDDESCIIMSTSRQEEERERVNRGLIESLKLKIPASKIFSDEETKELHAKLSSINLQAMRPSSPVSVSVPSVQIGEPETYRHIVNADGIEFYVSDRHFRK